MGKPYPRFLREGFTPFDPLEVARRTEEIAARGDARKYTAFYSTGVYGGISTGYAVGCCLRCIFCWVDPSRDFPEEQGEFYTPEQVAERLIENARRKGVPRLRISGGEPTLCKPHLLAVLERTEPTDYSFILETNGIPVAADEQYASDLARYTCAHIRVSLKAGTPEGFEARTGARGEFWELPFVAVERLLAAGADFHVAAMTDPRLMSQSERAALLARLRQAGYGSWVEEERCEAYRTTVRRLKAAGWDLSLD
ncbi:MAG: radical SAM protein [Anaerolineae bacterium]|jgi:uncharacterized Fe-S cluster-containing radical SAM superfamily protein